MAMTDTLAGIGHNRPDVQADVTARIAHDYASLDNDVTTALADAHKLPKDVTEENLNDFVTAIKRLRDLTKSVNSHHEAEKAPYLRGGQAIDGWFFTIWDKLARRNPKANPGALDILQARVDVFIERRLAAEEESRRKAHEEAERIRLATEEEARKREAAAEEARLAAERARVPHQIERKTEIATQAEENASVARIEAFVATNKAEQAEMMTLAKPADMVRTRVEAGILTAAKKDTATVSDYALLDLDKLRPYIKRDVLDVAVRQWAKTTGYTEPMPGVIVTSRHKGRIV